MNEGIFKKRLEHYEAMHNSVKIQRKKHVKTTLNAIRADIDEAKEEFEEAKNMEDCLILTKKWFGEKT